MKIQLNIKIIVLVIIFILLIGGGGYFIGNNLNRNNIIETNKVQVTPAISQFASQIPTQTNKDNSERYRIIGSEVIENVDGQQKVLFENVYNIKDVRLGPDGRTLHFQADKYDYKNYQEFCADLESKIEPLPSSYDNPPPDKPPWDYKRIAHAYTVNHCNTYYAGGYLTTSDYFVYLKITDSAHAKLYYEDLKTGDVQELELGDNILAGFVSKDRTNTVKFDTKSNYFLNEIEGKDGNKYVYPQQSSLVQGNKLVLAFGTLILAINIEKNNIIGWSIQQGVINNSFRLLNQNSLPYIVVESFWEGPPILNQIIDVSDDNWRSVSLTGYDKQSFFGFNVETVHWEQDSVTFNFTDFENATKKLPSKFDMSNIPQDDENKVKELNTEAEKYLKDNYQYIDVSCDFGGGMFFGCDGLKKIDHYRYNGKEGLLKY